MTDNSTARDDSGMGGMIDAGLVDRFRSALRFAASYSVISSADEQALLAAISPTGAALNNKDEENG